MFESFQWDVAVYFALNHFFKSLPFGGFIAWCVSIAIQYWFVSLFNYYGLVVIFSLFVFSPFLTAKSSRSGLLFRSVDQYVGLPMSNILRLLFLMYFFGVLPRGVVILDPHSVCFEL